MDKRVYAFLCVVCLVLILQPVANEVNKTEVCEWETFRPICSDMRVIFISSARYGRIQRGRCANMEANERPCFVDVQTFVDKQCGGRKTCNIAVLNLNIDVMPNSCSKELRWYLEISYHCQEVYHANEQDCVANRSVPVVTSTGYLANIVTDETNQGSSTCPWSIQLQPGQTVNLTLLDFGVYRSVTTVDKGQICTVYAVLKTSLPSSRIVVCGRDERETLVLTTEAREVQIAIQKSSIRDPAYFLIKYEVFEHLEGNKTVMATGATTSTMPLLDANSTTSSTMPSSGANSTMYSTNEVIVVIVIAGTVGLIAGVCITTIILTVKFRKKARAMSRVEQTTLPTVQTGSLEYEVLQEASPLHRQSTDGNDSVLDTLHLGQTDNYTAIVSGESAPTAAVDNTPASQMPHYDYVVAPSRQDNREPLATWV